MSRGRFAADSFAYVDQQIDGRTLIDIASSHLQETPAFWGRYFKRPGYARDYSPIRETPLLQRADIKVLPIARQTTGVGGTVDRGLRDGDANVEALMQAFDIKAPVLLFLDVENASLSLQYYIGWSNAIAERSEQRVLPAVYARTNDTATWRTLAHAADLGHATAGVWITRSRRGACASLPDWDPEFFMPAVPLPCPVFAWQFALDCYHRTLDFSMVNPAEEQSLLSRLCGARHS